MFIVAACIFFLSPSFLHIFISRSPFFVLLVLLNSLVHRLFHHCSLLGPEQFVIRHLPSKIKVSAVQSFTFNLPLNLGRC
uniref:Uncharacterized protein n=1 Tax=Kalanchoe fedtschenkoi TaxID=63787 RepID=A0A7N0TUB0_KALFE